MTDHRRNRCPKHEAIVRVPRGWRCDACDIADIHLPGELSPFVTWLDAPEPDPMYRRRLVDGAAGQVVLKDGDAPTAATAWAMCSPSTKRRRPWDTRGWTTVTIDPLDPVIARLEWAIEWFRPDEGEIVDDGDGVTFHVSAVTDDLEVVTIDAVYNIPPLRTPRYPVGGSVADLRRWRNERAAYVRPQL